MRHNKAARRSFRWIASMLALVLLLLPIGGCSTQKLSEVTPPKPAETPASGMEQQPAEPESVELIPELLEQVDIPARQQLLSFSTVDVGTPVTPSVASYAAATDLSNVTNLDRFYLSDSAKALLAENLFVVQGSYGNEFFELYYGYEFFELYEYNRYLQIPNFVTVDSLMHIYHLYFSLLLNRTEKNALASELCDLSEIMLANSMAQYQVLIGTEWEEAARKNVAFFSVAALLQDSSLSAPNQAADVVARELDCILAAEDIAVCGLTGEFLDYSQFKPRGYYEGDAVLEAYFRAMMWYGQLNFTQQTDVLNRCALLMTLAMEDGALPLWEEIYTVTACFAGASDDLGYYEYAPAILEAYGGWPNAAALIGNDEAYGRFTALTAQMDPPVINSVPVWDGTEDIQEQVKGFRFMGQRFTVDAAIMQQLVYSSVKENSSGEKRMLPDTLDVAAALGSDTALALLAQQGETDYAGYSEHMAQLRTVIETAPASTWSASLYAGWLYTLMPLLEEKGAGYPSFMTGSQWQKKNLETFAGSFTELKHDTVLYAKQMMAEMGGGPMEKVDDRGYVEPETEVYRRFLLLTQQTSEGLDRYGILGSDDRENLSRLAELAQRLLTISEKELTNQSLTEEEYDLIRDYGGTLEHFWIEAVRDKSESEWLDTQEIPAALVTDIATDPNGSVLQIATGKPSEILVIFPIDGELHLASGLVYDFYQFVQPISERMTDTEWRQEIGVWMTDDGTYNWDHQVEKPWWTESYREER